jgi:hypothetical protein
MTVIPPNELFLLKSLAIKGRRVLEFGNKRNKTGCYRDWYLAEGAQSYTSIDWNGEDGALALDVREMLRPRLDYAEYDLVTNFGFSEHVDGGQEAFFRNVHELCALGGYMVHMIPLEGHWQGHEGIRCTYTEWFLPYLAINNLYLPFNLGVDKTQGEGRHLVVGVFKKLHAAPFYVGSTMVEVGPC